MLCPYMGHVCRLLPMTRQLSQSWPVDTDTEDCYAQCKGRSGASFKLKTLQLFHREQTRA